MTLFHVSEEAAVAIFHPRPDPNGKLGPVVWAIDEEHLPNYLLPRDCARVTFAACPSTSGEDRLRFLASATAPRVVAIENAWLERAARQTLWIYRFPSGTFEKIDDCAGYWVSRMPVVPESTERVPSALAALLSCEVELRVVRNLWPLRDAVAESTLAFSLIRMRNALPRSA
jgi:hypothetical protein